MIPKNKVLQNYLYNVSYQIVMTILPLATIPYLTRVLGAHNLGIVRYMESVSQILTVFGLLGLVWYANRAIAYNRGSVIQLSKCFYEIFLLRLILLSGTLIVFGIIVRFSEYSQLFWIYGIFIAGTFLDIGWFYTGIEEMKPLVVRNYIIRIISTVLLFTLIHKQDDLTVYVWITCLTTLVGAVVILPFARSKLERVPLHEINIHRHIVPALSLFLPQAASQIYVQCDKLMIKHLIRDPSYISFYTENEKIAKMPVILATALSTVLMPRIAYEFSRGRRDSVTFYISKSFLCTFFVLAPCCVGLIAVAPSFVPVFLGAEFADTYNILRMFCPIMIFVGFSNVTGIQYLVALNRTKELTISYVSAAVINLLLDLLLIPRIGVYGAIIGTVMAELLVFIIQYNYMRKDFGSFGIQSEMLIIMISAAVMGIAVFMIGCFPCTRVVRLIMQVVSGVLLYVVFVKKTGIFRVLLKKQ